LRLSSCVPTLAVTALAVSALALVLTFSYARHGGDFCSRVAANYKAAGSPMGNQDDWLWENYPRHTNRARRCLGL